MGRYFGPPIASDKDGEGQRPDQLETCTRYVCMFRPLAAGVTHERSESSDPPPEKLPTTNSVYKTKSEFEQDKYLG